MSDYMTWSNWGQKITNDGVIEAMAGESMVSDIDTIKKGLWHFRSICM